jgi:hypothetical protein
MELTDLQPAPTLQELHFCGDPGAARYCLGLRSHRMFDGQGELKGYSPIRVAGGP